MQQHIPGETRISDHAHRETCRRSPPVPSNMPPHTGISRGKRDQTRFTVVASSTHSHPCPECNPLGRTPHHTSDKCADSLPLQDFTLPMQERHISQATGSSPPDSTRESEVAIHSSHHPRANTWLSATTQIRFECKESIHCRRPRVLRSATHCQG